MTNTDSTPDDPSSDEAEMQVIDVTTEKEDTPSEDDNADRSDTSPSDGNSDDSIADVVERGREEARRHIQQAEGDTLSDQIENAVDTLKTKHKQLEKQQEQALSKADEKEQAISNLQETITHLKELNERDDPPLVLRKWAGGIQTALDGDFDSTISDLRDQVDQIQQDQQQLTEHAEKLKRGCQTVVVAIRVAKQTRSTIPDQPQQATQQELSSHDGGALSDEQLSDLDTTLR